MIKLVACIFMVIDHVGFLFFPDIYVLRLIGRLSMPLFAYCVARGFYYTSQKGTLNKYINRMAGFGIASQIPYMLMVNEIKANIGVLWFFSLVFLQIVESNKRTALNYLKLFLIIIITTIAPMDFGLYGMCFLLILYYFDIKKTDINKYFLGYSVIHALYFIKGLSYGFMQLFTLPVLSLLAILKKYDNKIKLGKQFFYIFYPAHIMALVVIRALMAAF